MNELHEWWPEILVQLHKHEWVNYPPAIDSILAGLISHTASYLILDKEAGAVIRAAASKSMIETIQSMDKLHNEAMATR